MIQVNLRQKITAVALCAVLLITAGAPAFAAEPHENPETARVVFSGISLLRYYTDSLDFVLHKDPVEVQARLEKMPFANILESLENPAGNFTASGVGISFLIVDIDNDVNRFSQLVKQSRFKEALELAAQTFDRLSQAYNELDIIEESAGTTGVELKVASAPAKSDLRQAYDDLLEKIDRIRQMLDLYKSLLLMPLIETELLELEDIEEIIESLEVKDIREIIKLLEVKDILPVLRLLPTDLTLEIEPAAAFVGDRINFRGSLTSGGKPLAGREIDILLDSLTYATAMTDAYGRYQGTLQVPYWYIPQIEVQALYYPRDKDTGVYLASLSPAVKLTVLFYEANLEVVLEDKAYPGLETTVNGRFDYGQSPSLDERTVEIYFDDALVFEGTEQKTFSRKMMIDSEMEPGVYNITISARPAGRYAPAVGGAILNITRAIPILDISLPGVALIPGSVSLAGKLYSEVGPLSGASVKMSLGKSRVELASSENGDFDTKIRAGISLGLIGSQDLAIQVLPQEPWHTALVTTRSLVMVNWLNCLIILVILVILGVYLPRRMQGRLGEYFRKRERQIVTVPVESAPAYSQVVVAPVPAEEIPLELRDRIFYWYRLVVKLLVKITRALLGPQQTLREFAGESGKALGPASKHFTELTVMVERLLYSRYRPTEADAEKSRRLSLRIEEETGQQLSTQPVLDNQLSAGELEFVDTDMIDNLLRQPSTQLWIILILVVAYYAFILLFLLPLLVMSAGW